MDREAWQATIHGVPKSQMRLSMHACPDHILISGLLNILLTVSAAAVAIVTIIPCNS